MTTIQPLAFGNLFFIGIKGTALTCDEKKWITENNISGITLFRRNITEPKQLKELCKEIQSLSMLTKSKLPFFIAIDMEGGRVHRLPKKQFLTWPETGSLYTEGDINNAKLRAFKHSSSMGIYLKSLGINLNWSPCLDIFTNKKNEVIGNRALNYSHFKLQEELTKNNLKPLKDYEIVNELGKELLKGFKNSLILSCAKHFPGHGNTLIDSHESLPIENIDRHLLDNRELQSFKMAIKQKVPFIMTAHILFKNIDKNLPVSLSPVFIKQILKKELGYKGIVISDDLDMKALQNYSHLDKALLALKAGCDMLLYCNSPLSPVEVLDLLKEKHLSAEEKNNISISLKKVNQLRLSLDTSV